MERAFAPSSSDAAGLLAAAPGTAAWEWDLADGTARFSAAVADLLGVPAGELRPAWATFRARVMPGDLPELAVPAELDPHHSAEPVAQGAPA